MPKRLNTKSGKKTPIDNLIEEEEAAIAQKLRSINHKECGEASKSEPATIN